MSPMYFHVLFTIGIVLNIVGSTTAQSTLEAACPESQFTERYMNGVVTPGDANNIRAEPASDAEIIGQVSPGEPFNLVYPGIACADGYLWREIETLTVRGWTVEIPLEGEEPFIVPYVSQPRQVGERAEDGSIRVEENGIAFTVPAGLNIAQVTVMLDVGLFGLNTMSAQPSAIKFLFLDEDDEVRGEIEIFPYAISDDTYDYLGSTELETLLTDQPSLLEYAAEERMPQLPISGAQALIGGAGAYVPFGSGSGLRYITYFAQDSVLFTPDTLLEYLYRGITTDQAFFITGQGFPVQVPAETVPPEIPLYTDAYVPYLRDFEARLAEQPTSAFTPDLALLDAIFASLTITDNEALLELIP